MFSKNKLKMTLGHYIIPKLVEEVSLKRARTELDNGDEAIRVVTTNGGGTISVDAQDFADGTGLAPAQTYAGSVNHRLLTLAANSTTNTQNITALSTTLGQTTDTSASASVMGVLKGISENIPAASDLSTVDANTTTLTTSIGNTTDTASDSTVIGILKDITGNLPSSADLTTVNTNTGSLVTTTGTINTTTSALATSIGNTTDTASDPTVIGLLKDVAGNLPTSADLTTVNTNTGSLVTTTDTINTTTSTMNTTLGTINSTQGSVSDAAWTGTGDATVIALLKGIVNKLN